MEEIIKFLEDECCEFEVGWKEKERKKTMSEAMKKLKETGDENKISYAKTLASYYGIFLNMGYILNPKKISLKKINMRYIIFVVI